MLISSFFPVKTAETDKSIVLIPGSNTIKLFSSIKFYLPVYMHSEIIPCFFPEFGGLQASNACGCVSVGIERINMFLDKVFYEL